MITFEEGELEIAMVTYNRCEFVADWLDICYEDMRKRNIHFSIYDSSTNDDTELYIKRFKEEHLNTDIEFHRIDSEYLLGMKPLLPLMQSASKYVWVAGDSRYWDYEMLDREVFPRIKQNMDCIVLYVNGCDENIEKIYTNMQEFVNTAFISLTCIGATIYKTSVFEPLKKDRSLRIKSDEKYGNNYAFGWLGYFLEALLSQEHRTFYSITKPPVIIRSDEKKWSWGKRYCQCWVKDLLDILDGIAYKCKGTDQIAKDAWLYISLDDPQNCYFARKEGDLTPQTYEKYMRNGMLDRCSRHVDRLERFAYAGDEELDELLKREMEMVDRQFQELCQQNIERIRRESKGCSVWIYGAGVGGKILKECLKGAGIPIQGFLDRQAKQIGVIDNIPVQTVDETSLEDAYVIISMRTFSSYCANVLLQAGMSRNRIFYPVVDCF
ncbi:MAG: hypothetical protein NC413_01705 [Muribaculum sp.]|nr:hypothetical protein [Muribaculum sp.]